MFRSLNRTELIPHRLPRMVAIILHLSQCPNAIFPHNTFLEEKCINIHFLHVYYVKKFVLLAYRTNLFL